ncbi:MAG: hypothetical protein K1X53_11970 [Candidatus Sumerlaeaceae bacterium]|nr:hypothetical protein [Candidatus Sumerlaeaceae bacterium]
MAIQISRSAVTRTLIALALVIAAVLYWAFRPTVEKEVRRDVERIAESTSARNVDAVADCIADSYSGEFQSDKISAVATIKRGFAEVTSLQVALDEVEIKIAGDGKHAEAVVVYFVTGSVYMKEISGPAPFKGLVAERLGSPEALYARFVRSDGRWKVEFVTWKLDKYLPEFPEARKRLGK